MAVVNQMYNYRPNEANSMMPKLVRVITAVHLLGLHYHATNLTILVFW